jgi:hypothetical protein
MKLVKITILSIALTAILLTSAEASRQVGGLIIGGGTGAIVGNVVGQNVESTILGAAVGGVLGFAIGNELDRHHDSVNKQPVVVSHSQRYIKHQRPLFKNHTRHNNYRKSRYRDYPRYRHNSKNCRKVVTVKKGYNKTKRVVSTVCGTNHRKQPKRHNPNRYNNRYYR